MKVDNPTFVGGSCVVCKECPLDDGGVVNTELCFAFTGCPTKETYAEACTLAEKETPNE